RRPRLCCLLLAGACGGNGESEPPARTRGEPRFVEARFRDVVVRVPESWTRDPRNTGTGGVMFLGPEEEGFRPNFHVYWGSEAKQPEKFFEQRRLTLLNGLPPARILDEEDVVVAGMPARRFIYALAGSGGDYRCVDWCFTGGRGHGVLRATSAAGAFFHLRPLFDRIAASARLAPP
ncbi:MAG: hypothetical protein ACREID_09660, partial [Planctomycetota bacterium]